MGESSESNLVVVLPNYCRKTLLAAQLRTDEAPPNESVEQREFLWPSLAQLSPLHLSGLDIGGWRATG